MRFDWWTLALQLVNVVVLIWILSRFLFRPLADMISARQASIAQALEDVAAKQAEIEADRSAVEHTRAGFQDERAKLLAAAGTAAAREREAVLQAADAEAKERLAGADQMLARLRQDSEARLADHTISLAAEIAAKLVGRLEGAAVRKAFADALFEGLKALPSTKRELLVSDEALSVVTPSALPPDEADMICRRVAEALGGTPRVTQRVQPQLLGGVELHGSQVVVRNSWQADLDAIAAEMRDDRR